MLSASSLLLKKQLRPHPKEVTILIGNTAHYAQLKAETARF